MTHARNLKVHTPISTWRNLHDHVTIGDIIYVTLPIEPGTIRFRLLNNKLKLEIEGNDELNQEKLEDICYDLLAKDDWSSQFIGYAYPKDDSLVLYAIYDMTFNVYLDGITVQQLAETYGFKPHPILYHGSVKPKADESVADFVKRTISESRVRAFKKIDVNEKVIVENVSRLYEYRRIIGAWTYVNEEAIQGFEESKKYILSI